MPRIGRPKTCLARILTPKSLPGSRPFFKREENEFSGGKIKTSHYHFRNTKYFVIPPQKSETCCGQHTRPKELLNALYIQVVRKDEVAQWHTFGGRRR